METPPRRLIIPILVLTVVGALVASCFMGGRRLNQLRACGSVLIALPHLAAKDWRDVGAGPARDDWQRQLDEPRWVAQVGKRCPREGRYRITVAPRGSLDVGTTYSARCSVHGDIQAVKAELGPDHYQRMLNLVPAAWRPD